MVSVVVHVGAIVAASTAVVGWCYDCDVNTKGAGREGLGREGRRPYACGSDFYSCSCESFIAKF